MKLCLLLLIGCAATMLAQEGTLYQYDRLGRENVNVTAKEVASGGRDKTIEVSLSPISAGSGPARIEFYAAAKRHQGITALDLCGEASAEVGAGKYEFPVDARMQRAKGKPYKGSVRLELVAGGYVTGWFVRVIRGEQIIGVAASGPQWEEMARNPVKLEVALASRTPSGYLASR